MPCPVCGAEPHPRSKKGSLTVPGLEAHRVNLVPPGDISRCAFCGTDYREGLSFVAFDNNVDSEPVPAGLIESVDKQAGRHVYRARDAFGRGSTTVSLELPQVCSGCITQAAELVGFEDGTPLRAEADELRAELERVTAERDQAIAEQAEAEAALKGLQVVERLFGGNGKGRPKAKAAA